jgi:hypothetical protein
MGDGFAKALNVTAVADTIPCHGGTTTVTVTATGGTPPYTGTGTFVVTAGTYSYNVTDINLVPGHASILVTQPTFALTADIFALPPPCLGGTTVLSLGVGGGTQPYSYLWSDGSTSLSISNATPGTYSVTVTDDHGCTASDIEEAILQPPTSVSISPSANPVNAGTEVIFTAIPVNGGYWQYYFWKVNDVDAGYGMYYFNYIPANNDVVTCIMYTSEGCIDTSNAVTMTVNIVPVTQIVQNDTVYDGQTTCYDAIQTIIVAGNGTTFLVQTGGSVNMIAGQNIQYLPGTRVEWGGMLHGYISLTGEECPFQAASLVSASKESDTGDPVSELSFFKIYPNPTNGIFHLELTEVVSNIETRVEIYGMRSERIMSEEVLGKGRHEFSLAQQPAGIYFIKVIAGEKLGFFKIVKTR